MNDIKTGQTQLNRCVATPARRHAAGLTLGAASAHAAFSFGAATNSSIPDLTVRAILTNPGRLGSAYPYWNAAVRMALFLLTAEVVASLAEALRREQEVARREREAAEQLRELDRMKDSILQTIAHDRLAGGSVFNLLLPGSDEEGFAQSEAGA